MQGARSEGIYALGYRGERAIGERGDRVSELDAERAKHESERREDRSRARQGFGDVDGGRERGEAHERGERARVMCLLQKYAAVLLVCPAFLVQRLARLADMGFPPGSDGGPLLKNPIILSSSLQYNTVEWLIAKGFPEPQIRRMILSRPEMLMYSPTSLGPMLEYVAWVVGSKETTVKLLTKQSSMFGKRPSSIHAKLLILKELAYRDMGCERFPTTNSLEDAIIVCQERWAYEWKAKFDELSLRLQAAWKVSGIAGLTNIEHLVCKEEG
eukprot:gene18341-24806_t